MHSDRAVMVSNDRNQDSSKRSDSKRVITCTKYDLFMVIASLIYMGVAMASFYGVRNQISGKKTNSSFLDAIYFTIVLMTSAGYKDLQPHTTLAILLAIFFAIVGIFVIGVMASLGADYFLASRIGKKELLELVVYNKTVKYPKRLKIMWKALAGVLAVHTFIGTPLFIVIGDMQFCRALRCVSSTFTTVLGDEVCFSTEDRRIFAVFWILFGMITLSGAIYIAAETYHHRREWLGAKKHYKLVGMLPNDLGDDGLITEDGFIEYQMRRKERLPREVKEDVKVKKPDFHTHQASWMKYLNPSKTMNSDDLWDMAILFVSYMGLSMVIFYAARFDISGAKKTNGILDTVYFAFIIMTSVGYGDLSPRTPLAYILSCFFSLWGMYVFGALLHKHLEALDEQRDMSRKDDPSSMQQNLVIAKKSFKKPGKRIGFCLMAHIVVGTAIVVGIEGLGFIRAVYCISITITSAGTEECFSTKLGRSFAIVWIIIGFSLKNFTLIVFANYYTVINRRSKKKVTTTVVVVEPKKEDPKEDKPVRIAMIDQRIEEEEIQYREREAFREEFRKLDPRGTNKLTLREIMAS